MACSQLALHCGKSARARCRKIKKGVKKLIIIIITVCRFTGRALFLIFCTIECSDYGRTYARTVYRYRKMIYMVLGYKRNRFIRRSSRVDFLIILAFKMHFLLLGIVVGIPGIVVGKNVNRPQLLPYDPTVTTGAAVIASDGMARFTVLTPKLVRMEYAYTKVG